MIARYGQTNVKGTLLILQTDNSLFKRSDISQSVSSTADVMGCLLNAMEKYLIVKVVWCPRFPPSPINRRESSESCLATLEFNWFQFRVFLSNDGAEDVCIDILGTQLIIIFIID